MRWMATYTPQPPYDFALTVSAARFTSVLGRAHGDAYRRLLRVGAALALVEVTARGSVEAPGLEARLLAHRGVPDENALHQAVVRWLHVDSDVRPFYDFARGEPLLWATVERLYGLHGFRAASVWEALATTIIEQQIALRSAQAAERWLIDWGGESLDYEGARYAVFPRPEVVAAASVDDLRPLKITFIRMARLIALAQAQTDGTLDLEALYAHDAESIYRALVALKGVGHWTAGWTMTRAFGHYVYVGAADVALRAAANHYFHGQPGRIAPAALDAAFARFRPHEGIACYYLLLRWALERYTGQIPL